MPMKQQPHLSPRRSACGFTLIEVLVALAIVAIALLAGGKAMNALTQTAGRQSDVMLAQFAFEQHRHLGVELRQYLLLQFDEFDRQALALELLGHFEADETGAYRHGAHSRFSRSGDAVHVFERAQREDAFVVDAGDRRANRRRAG